MMPAISPTKATTSRQAVLDYLRGCRPAWASWKQLSHAAGIRFGARIFELKRAGYQIEDRPSNTGTGYDYSLIGEPSPQASLPLPTPRKLTKSAQRERDAVVRWLRASPFAVQLTIMVIQAIERGEHLR